MITMEAMVEARHDYSVGIISVVMHPDELRTRFSKIHVWQRGGKRAINKPMLALWAIGQCLAGKQQFFSYEEVAEAQNYLLRRFGPPRQPRPALAFQHLCTDDLWVVHSSAPLTETTAGNFHVQSLKRGNAKGGFPDEVFESLRNDTSLATEIAFGLVDAHFESTQLNEVLDTVGISSKYEYVRRRARDSEFSFEVKSAYGHQCAVCEFAVKMFKGRIAGDIALDAGHIRWHNANGPDQVSNGLSLCALHHRLFDAGAFTLTFDHRVVVATSALGQGLENTLGRFHLKPIVLPGNQINYPDMNYLKWHHNEVFGPLPGEVHKTEFDSS